MYFVKGLKGKKYVTIKELAEIKDVIKYLKDNKIYYTGSPYIFTHVNLSNGNIISQSIGGLICSPDKLRTELKKLT